MATLALRHINKIYGNRIKAIDDFNLTINHGEFVVLVGPSGSGKSTILRMMAGLEEITVGELYINDVISNEIAPKDRSIAMVFQNYALYPHLTVYENVVFGLKSAHLKRSQEKERVEKVARILEIESLLGRKPGHLSGGQKQRVALARAIVRSPEIFLLDEPLSNLDALLRNQMRASIARLHHELKTTFIYVTHDQLEALSLADKIVVLNDGQTMQIGSPKEIYDTPANRFVATFLGNPPMNIIPSRLSVDGNSFSIGNWQIAIPQQRLNEIFDTSYYSHAVDVGLRAHHFHVVSNDQTERLNTITGRIVAYETTGETALLQVAIAGLTDSILVSGKAVSDMPRNGSITLEVHTEKIHIFDQNDGRRLIGVPMVNIINHLSCRAEDDIRVNLGSQTITLAVLDRLIDREALSKEMAMTIKTESISLIANQRAISLTGVIAHVVTYENKKGVFLSLPGLSEKIAFYVDGSMNPVIGTRIDFFIDPSGINLLDSSGQRLIAKQPLSNNRLPKTFNHKIARHQELNGRTITYGVDPRSVSLSKKRWSSTGLVLPAEIYDADFMGATTVLYCRIPSSKEYFTAIIKGRIDMHLTPRVKLFVPYAAINSAADHSLS